MAPVGTALGQTDSFPLLTPVYRLAVELRPDEPLQFIGRPMLAAFFLLFLVTNRFVLSLVDRRPGRPHRCSGRDRAAGRHGAVCPAVLRHRLGHVSLMHQWVIVWALVLALGARPT